MACYAAAGGALTTGDFDAAKYPIPPAIITPTADQCIHTPTPEGYASWFEWCEIASKKHRQVRCPRCGKFEIWLPKKMATEYEARVQAEAISRSDQAIDRVARTFASRKRGKKQS